MPLSVVILTLNAERTIGATLDAALCVSDDIHVVDSGSSDRTLAICDAQGAQTHFHNFASYGAQRNWAIANVPLRHEWQLHVDADEYLSAELVEAIIGLQNAGFPEPIVGYFIPRVTQFLGRAIRHGGMYPTWHMRLFKSGHGRCETRRYDQHFIVDGPTGRLNAAMVDDVRMSLTEWTSRHNRWSDAEAAEAVTPSLGAGDRLVQPKFVGTPVQRKRALRRVYDRAPMFLRALLLFLYRYFLRLGFLDGRPGLIFFALQTFWFRFLVDAKIYERSRIECGSGGGRSGRATGSTQAPQR